MKACNRQYLWESGKMRLKTINSCPLYVFPFSGTSTGQLTAGIVQIKPDSICFFLFISIITLSKLGNKSSAVLINRVIHCQSGNQQVLTENCLFTLLKPEGPYFRFKTPLFFISLLVSHTNRDIHYTLPLFTPFPDSPHSIKLILRNGPVGSLKCCTKAPSSFSKGPEHVHLEILLHKTGAASFTFLA